MAIHVARAPLNREPIKVQVCILPGAETCSCTHLSPTGQLAQDGRKRRLLVLAAGWILMWVSDDPLIMTLPTAS